MSKPDKPAKEENNIVKIIELIQDANKNPAKLPALRNLLTERPEIVTELSLMEGTITGAIIDRLTKQDGTRAFYRAEVARRLLLLLEEGDSEIEMMLARRVIVCWLAAQQAELARIASLNGDYGLKQHEYLDKSLSLAEARFSRACESLVKVRAMLAMAEVAKAKRSQVSMAKAKMALALAG